MTAHPVEPAKAKVSGIRVDDDGVFALSDREVVVDVLFDDRRIWSFWLQRDGRIASGGYHVAWPPSLTRFLDGVTRLKLAEHVNQRVLFDQKVRFRDGTKRIEVVDARGRPLGIDKSLRLAQTFDTRTPEQVAPLLDSVETVLGALEAAGVEAFLAYGTLLGAVRGGSLIGYDSDADLGYVSEHTAPVDVTRESFRLQRALVEMGFTVHRYSGAAFKVDVLEADGSRRGLDVFGGFVDGGGYLNLMGEIRVPFHRDWVFPLGTTTLEGRLLPAPRYPDKLLAATYGPNWRVPDPAFKFETPRSTVRRLNGWFRGVRINKASWDRSYSGVARRLPKREPSELARWALEREGVPAQVVDIGCGRGQDALLFARVGSQVTALDFAPQGAWKIGQLARREGHPFDLRPFNLNDTRSVLGTAAFLAHTPGPRVVIARHIADATDSRGRQNLWRTCDMLLRDGGRLYLEFLMRPNPVGDSFQRKNHLRTLPFDLVVAELEGSGGVVVHREVRQVSTGPGMPGRRIGRLVGEWRT